MSRTVSLVAVLLLAVACGWAEQSYSVTGMVLKVDRSHRTMIVSCQSIPGYMDAMAMPFSVPGSRALDGVTAGAIVDFTLVVGNNRSSAKDIHLRKFESLAQDPWEAHQLTLLQSLVGRGSSLTSPLSSGQHVPDFHLIDQASQPVTLAQFAGKVVAMNFVYTRCVLPDFCYRLTNNFGRLQQRFARQMGRDLILLTITFDPIHDRPELMANYARTWKADPKTWHFLTGPSADVQQVCHEFGEEAWQDEGLLTHTLHTVIIDRHGRLTANLEGNQFSAEQLGDLVQTILKRAN